MVGDGVSTRRRGGLWDHGPKACRRQSRSGPTVQRASDGRNPRCSDPGIWPAFGGATQPGGQRCLALRGKLKWSTAAVFIVAQILGAIAGVWLAHLMFDLPLWQLSGTTRTGRGQWLAEAVATSGLVLAILGCMTRTPGSVPYAVGLYITSAYWFTASTSFANPAVTIARSLSDTFAGIAPAGVAAFIAPNWQGCSRQSLSVYGFGASQGPLSVISGRCGSNRPGYAFTNDRPTGRSIDLRPLQPDCLQRWFWIVAPRIRAPWQTSVRLRASAPKTARCRTRHAFWDQASLCRRGSLLG